MGIEVLLMELARSSPEAAIAGVIALGASMFADRRWGAAGVRRRLARVEKRVATLYQRLGEPVPPPSDPDA